MHRQPPKNAGSSPDCNPQTKFKQSCQKGCFRSEKCLSLSIGNLINNLKREIMTKGFKELLALAKADRVTTIDELENLVGQCKNEITGADVDQVRQKLKIKWC